MKIIRRVRELSTKRANCPARAGWLYGVRLLWVIRLGGWSWFSWSLFLCFFWRSKRKKKCCFDSFTSLCVKRHPHQLETKEIGKIKKMLTDPGFDHWPIVSIASLALRKKRIVASLYSWYKYARLI